MRSYQDHLEGIASREHALRVALQEAIDKAAAKAFDEGKKRFSVPIPKDTSEEIVTAVAEHYRSKPHNWPVRVDYNQLNGNSIYFG